jgi:hypothetical protein
MTCRTVAAECVHRQLSNHRLLAAVCGDLLGAVLAKAVLNSSMCVWPCGVFARLHITSGV